MIIICETGRFGNQLFQFNYCLKLKKKNEIILFIGFGDLEKFLKKDNNLIFIKCKNFLFKFLNYFFSFLIMFKIINSVKENEYQEIKNKRGFLKNITFVQGYFENEKYIENKISSRFSKMRQEKEAIKYIGYLKKKFSKHILFVHIRLTDQLIGCFKEASSELPLRWFFKCQNIFKKKFKNCKFIYLSDDLEFLKANFKNSEFIKNRDKYYNFFIMKHCDGGILSPSTFSWWAAFLSQKTSFYAPLYWHGHKIKKQWPPKMVSSFIKYAPVLKKEYKNQIRNESKFYKMHI